MKAGTGRITKMAEEFLSYNGDAIFTSNEIDYRFIQQVAHKKGFSISGLKGKRFLTHTSNIPITAWGIAQTSV